MSGANMSVVGRAVLKCFATGVTGEAALGDAFVVYLEMFVQIRLRLKPFVTAGTFVRFLTGVDALMSD